MQNLTLENTVRVEIFWQCNVFGKQRKTLSGREIFGTARIASLRAWLMCVNKNVHMQILRSKLLELPACISFCLRLLYRRPAKCHALRVTLTLRVLSHALTHKTEILTRIDNSTAWEPGMRWSNAMYVYTGSISHSNTSMVRCGYNNYTYVVSIRIRDRSTYMYYSMWHAFDERTGSKSYSRIFSAAATLDIIIIICAVIIYVVYVLCSTRIIILELVATYFKC